MDIDVIERLFRLIRLLRSGRSYGANSLAEEVGCSRRTLFRDIALLETAGVPIRYDRTDHTYSLDRSFFMTAVSLSIEEVLALMLATRKALPIMVAPDHPALVSAAMKIESTLPVQMQELGRSLIELTDVREWPASDHESVDAICTTLRLALHDRRKVILRYDSYYEGKVIEAVVHPHRLMFAQRGWYLIAFSEQEGKTLTFKLERITGLELSQEYYTPDDEFSLDEYFGNAWQMIRGERSFHVRLRFSQKVAGNVEEVLWHKTQSTHRLSDGCLIFEADVDGVHEISWWVLGYGDQVEVLEPPELRQLVAERIERLAAMYRVGPHHGPQPTAPPASSPS